MYDRLRDLDVNVVDVDHHGSREIKTCSPYDFDL